MKLYIYESPDEIDFERPLGYVEVPDDVDAYTDIQYLLKRHFRGLVGTGGVTIVEKLPKKGIIIFKDYHGKNYCVNLID